MNISPRSPRTPSVPLESSPGYEMTAARPQRTGNDRFVDMVFHSSTDTPFSDAYTNKITDTRTPIAERVTLGMMFPLLIPITVILDVILYPWIKLGQFVDWVKDKLS